MGLQCFGDFKRHSSASPLGYVLLFACLIGFAWMMAGG